MATLSDITLLQGNNETLSGTVTSGGSAQNLTGVALTMVIKSSAVASDSSGTTIGTATGEITVVSAAAGTYSVAVPTSVTTSAGVKWYRIDATSGGTTRTVVYGELVVDDV